MKGRPRRAARALPTVLLPAPRRPISAMRLSRAGAAGELLALGEQLGEGLVEGPRDLAEHHHRHVALGALEARQVR